MNLSLGQPSDMKGYRLFIQGSLLCALEDYDLAKMAFLGANRLIPNNDQIATGMFTCAFATSNYRQAFFWAGRLIDLSPENPDSWLKLAICWMAAGVGFEARNSIECALELDPANTYFQRFWIECDDCDEDS